MQFDRIAPHYPWMEWLFASGLMQRCRTAHIGRTHHCRNALLAGEGHGRFLEVLLQTNPQIRVTCVESSAKMIEQMRQMLNRRGLDPARVTFQHENLMQCQWPDGRFDLIVTNFFLDCLKPAQIRRAVRLMAEHSTPDAIWLLADFRIPETGWRRWRAIGILASLYLFFRYSANVSARWLTPPDNFLKAVGFELRKRRLTSFGFAYSDWWQRG